MDKTITNNHITHWRDCWANEGEQGHRAERREATDWNRVDDWRTKCEDKRQDFKVLRAQFNKRKLNHRKRPPPDDEGVVRGAKSAPLAIPN